MTRRLSVMGLMVSGLLLLAMTSSMAVTQVELNGRPVALSVDPIQVVNRTMVPMRSIFEALGASVQWTSSTQTVLAVRDATRVQLTIGELAAMVNGQYVALDVPAMIYRGSTMVPLRFVSESLGADVRWNEATQTVSMFTSDTPNGTPVTDPVTLKEIGIPLGTVIPVSLDKSLSSATNHVGDGFTVTVQSNLNGDAEFPTGTKFTSSIIGVQKATASQPGTLDLSFTQALLPDGRRVRITGSLISLDDQSVTRTDDGRLVAKVAPTDNNRLKMIGIGAGAGLIIGKLLDKNLIVGGLLGAAAGYFYDQYTTNDATPTDVSVSAGTVFGVRMDRGVRYDAPEAFVTARNTYRSTH
ncbi:MAG: copper amine oxidase N-terminal domain-containing protein [Armatimonadota bacterium]